AVETERDRLTALAGRFSREDLLRSFDVLSRAEYDIRGAAQPRYHLEMALLRWIHLRKLVPLTELLGGMGGAPSTGPRAEAKGTIATRRSLLNPVAPAAVKPGSTEPAKVMPPPVDRRATMDDRRSTIDARPPLAKAAPATPPPVPVASKAPPGGEREAFLEEVKRTKVFFYN